MYRGSVHLGFSVKYDKMPAKLADIYEKHEGLRERKKGLVEGPQHTVAMA